MDGSQAYTLRKMVRTLVWSHTGHNAAGNGRLLVANHVTEFKKFNFWTY